MSVRPIGLFVVLVACKGGPPSGPAVCDAVELVSACGEYPSHEVARAACPALGGSVGEGACPEGAVATCRVGEATRHYYAEGGLPWTEELATRHCAAVLGGAP